MRQRERQDERGREKERQTESQLARRNSSSIHTVCSCPSRARAQMRPDDWARAEPDNRMSGQTWKGLDDWMTGPGRSG